MSEHAKYCIQCLDSKSGKVGDFLFIQDAPKIAISPVFENLSDLYSWMRQNGWEHDPNGWNSVHNGKEPEGIPSFPNVAQKGGTFRYFGNDNYGKPKSDYLTKIADMDDKALEKEAEQMIWMSAFANNNPKSDFHWMVDAIYDECMTRKQVEIYSRAFKAAKSSCGL